MADAHVLGNHNTIISEFEHSTNNPLTSNSYPVRNPRPEISNEEASIMNSWRTGRFLTLSICMVLCWGGRARSQEPQQAEVLLQAAINKQVVEGDLEEAIRMYADIVDRFAGNRPIAAKALLHMGRCYEKLGNEKAREAYERVLREYADQSELAANARARLAALEQLTEPDVAMDLTIRRLWTGLDVGPGNLGRPSPDSRYLSYSDPNTGNLAIYEFATKKKQLLTNIRARPGSPVFTMLGGQWSPDNRRLAYSLWNYRNWCELRIIGINGSEQSVLLRNEGRYGVFYPLDWSADGKYILTSIENEDEWQIALISVADGSTRPLKIFTEPVSLRPGSRLSPDGRFIACTLLVRDDPPERDIFILSTEGGAENPLVEHPADDYVLGWAPDGKRLLFASDRTGTWDAWIIEVANGRAQGEPELIHGPYQLKKEIGQVWPLGITREGSFYYGLECYMKDLYLAELNLDTGELIHPPQIVNQRFTGLTGEANWSPDGKYLLYRINQDTGPEQLIPKSPFRIRSLETGEEYELSVDLKSFGAVSWFPDSRSILMQASDENDREGFYRVDTQTGDASLVLEWVAKTLRPVWPPDEDKFFFMQWREDGTSSIWVYDLTSGKEEEFHNLNVFILHLAASPDGQYLAFDTYDGDIWVLNIMPSIGGEPRVLLKLNEGEQLLTIAWTPDGKGLLYGKGVRNEQKSEVWRIPLEGGEPHKLGLEVEGLGLGRLTIHPDGRRIAFVSERGGVDIWVMENFLPPLEEKQER